MHYKHNELKVNNWCQMQDHSVMSSANKSHYFIIIIIITVRMAGLAAYVTSAAKSGRQLFLLPNPQCQSTEGMLKWCLVNGKLYTVGYIKTNSIFCSGITHKGAAAGAIHANHCNPRQED